MSDIPKINDDFCKGCEYYCKPYWSVVSPCKNCPRIGNTGGYVTTTTTKLPEQYELEPSWIVKPDGSLQIREISLVRRDD